MRSMNIKVKIVEPGIVKTNLYNSIKNINIQNFPQEYHKSFKSWHKYLMDSFNKGYGPDVTANTIYKAAMDKSYKLRYASGPDIKMVFSLSSLLPFRLFNKLVKSLT